jgi:hypothetical protein
MGPSQQPHQLLQMADGSVFKMGFAGQIGHAGSSMAQIGQPMPMGMPQMLPGTMQPQSVQAQGMPAYMGMLSQGQGLAHGTSAGGMPQNPTWGAIPQQQAATQLAYSGLSATSSTNMPGPGM